MGIAAMRAIRQEGDKKPADQKAETMTSLKKTYDEAVKGLVEEYAGKKAEEDAKLAERLNKEKFTPSAKGAKEGALFLDNEVELIKTKIVSLRESKASKAKDTKKDAKKETN